MKKKLLLSVAFLGAAAASQFSRASSHRRQYITGPAVTLGPMPVTAGAAVPSTSMHPVWDFHLAQIST